MKQLLVLSTIVTGLGVLWFWVVYPAYLSMMECQIQAQPSISQISTERNKTVYSEKADVCQMEKNVLAEMDACYKEKSGQSIVHTVLMWYPPVMVEYEKLSQQHSHQCLF